MRKKTDFDTPHARGFQDGLLFGSVVTVLLSIALRKWLTIRGDDSLFAIMAIYLIPVFYLGRLWYRYRGGDTPKNRD